MHWVRYPLPEKRGPQLVEKKSEQRGVISGQRRSEPAAHPCRGPGDHAGEWHGGPPWLRERTKEVAHFV